MKYNIFEGKNYWMVIYIFHFVDSFIVLLFTFSPWQVSVEMCNGFLLSSKY